MNYSELGTLYKRFGPTGLVIVAVTAFTQPAVAQTTDNDDQDDGESLLELVDSILSHPDFGKGVEDIGVDGSAETSYFMSLPVLSNRVSDPAGHSCCISAPFGTIRLTLPGGNNVDLGTEGAAVLHYLPVDATISRTGEISGESESTVAGYSNVATEVTGQFTPAGLDLRIEVGANGALPSGLPITFDMLLDYSSYFHYSQIASPVLGLSAATGQSVRDWEIDPEKPGSFDLYLQLDESLGTTASDWFIVMLETDGDVSSFNLSSMQFEPGVAPSYQGPLIGLPATRLFSSPVQPEEGAIIAFGVDAMDGQLNENVIFNAITVVYP